MASEGVVVEAEEVETFMTMADGLPEAQDLHHLDVEALPVMISDQRLGGKLTHTFLPAAEGGARPHHEDHPPYRPVVGRHRGEDTENVMQSRQGDGALRPAHHTPHHRGSREKTNSVGSQDVVTVETEPRHLQTLLAHFHLDPAEDGALLPTCPAAPRRPLGTDMIVTGELPIPRHPVLAH